MPKVKTHKGLKKRLTVTGKGKLKRHKAFAGHLLSGKSGARKRHLRRTKGLPKAVEKLYKRMLAVD